MWTQGCCPMLVGVRLQYDRTRPGMSLLPKITNKAQETVKSILAGALLNQHPARLLQAGAMQPLKQAGGNKGPCQHGKTKLQEAEEIRAVGTMAPTAVTHGATA